VRTVSAALFSSGTDVVVFVEPREQRGLHRPGRHFQASK